MTDNIKLPPMPETDHEIKVRSAAGQEWCYRVFSAEQMQAYAREAVRLNAQAVPHGLEDRIEAAIQRIVDNHAPRRIPADPTDVDLVLAEVLALIRGKWPPFWIHEAAPAAPQPAAQQEDALAVIKAHEGRKT